MNDASAVGPDTLVTRNEEPIAVEVDRTVVMMSLAQGMYYGLEGPGPRIWALLEQPSTARQIAGTLAGEYQVELDTCLRDVCEFLVALRDAGLVRVSGA